MPFCWFCHDVALISIIYKSILTLGRPMLKRNLSNWRTAKVQASSQELTVFSHMSNVTRNPIFGGLRPGRTKTGLLIDRSY